MSTRRRRRFTYRLCFLVALLLTLTGGLAEHGTVVRAADDVRAGDIWVDPAGGSDGAAGADRGTAVRTLSEAWARLPKGTPFDRPHRIALTAELYPGDAMPHYFERLYGSENGWLSIVSVDGGGAAVLGGHVSMFDVRFVELVGVRIDSGADAFHCERCDHLRIVDATMTTVGRAAWEIVKVNQSSNVQILDSVLSGAGDNVIDFVAVHGGRIAGNTISDAGDWCSYVKGGSADIVVEGNEIFGCGTGGFTAGQGSGFQFMEPPYLTYEAENILVRHNVIHDVEGAGIGVNGGHSIVMERNSLSRVGARSHLIEVVFGGRSCDGGPDEPSRARCAEYLAAGGWGTTVAAGSDAYVRIPNKDIVIRDNVIEKPAGSASRWSHFMVAGPYVGCGQGNAPSPALADDGLVITGNVIRNGGPDMPLGVGGDGGCGAANPTCNEAQLYRDNDINGR